MLVDNLPIGVYRTTPGDHGTFLEANRACLRMFGFESLEDLTRLRVSDVYANSAERRTFSDRVLKEGSVSGVELQLKRADGATLWGSVTAKSVVDEATGEVAWFDCAIEDVTARRRALEIQGLMYRIADAAQLARDERSLFDTIRRELGTFLDTRNLFVALYDCENDAITLPYLVDEHDQDAFASELRTFPAGRTLTRYMLRQNRSLLAREEEMRALEEAGEVELVGTPSKVWLGVPLEASGDPSLYQGQRVVGAIVVQSYTDPAAYGRDEQEILEFVSGQIGLAIERVRGERELRRLKEFNEDIVQNMAEGIALQDADGYFTFVNPAAAQMLGYDPSPSSEFCLVGQHWTRVVPEDQQPIVIAADRRRLAGAADRYEVELLHRDGSRFPVLISGSPRFEDEPPRDPATRRTRFVGTLAVFTAIGERVAAEARLARYAQQMAALYDTSLEINAQPNLPTLLTAIVQRAARLIEVRMGGLYLVRPDGQSLELVVAHSFPPERVGTVLQFGEGLSGRIAQSGQAMMVSDYQQWHGRAAVYAGDPFRRVLGVPMKVGDRVIGVINLTDDRPTVFPQGEAFTEEQLRLASLFADQAAIAVENANLFEAEREQRELAEALRQATTAVSSSLDLDQILDQILEQVDRVIPGDAVNITLIEDGVARIVRARGYDRFGSSIETVALPLANTPSLRHMQETGEAMVIADTSRFDGWVSLPEVWWIRSYAAAPIRVRDGLIGFLNVDSATPGFFSATEADRLQAFADQVSVALANAQLFGFVEQAKRDWEATFDAMQDPVVLTDVGGRVVRANLAFARLAGRPVEQVVGKEVAAMLTHDSSGQYVGGCTRSQCTLEHVLRDVSRPSGPAVQVTTCVHRYRDRVFEVQATRGPEYPLQGTSHPSDSDVSLLPAGAASLSSAPIGGAASPTEPDVSARVIYTLRDITERKRAEEELQRRNRDLTLLNRIVASAAARRPVEAILETICDELARALDTPRVAIWLLNSDYTESAIVSAYSATSFPANAARRVRLDDASARRVFEVRTGVILDGGAAEVGPEAPPVRSFLCWPATASGLWLPLIVDGQVAGHLEVVAPSPRWFAPDEITLVRRVAEQAVATLARARLEETERRLSAAVEQAAEAVVITDTEFAILYANPAFEQITGVKRSAEPLAPGDTRVGMRDLVAVMGEASLHRALWESVRAGKVWQGRVPGNRPDGTPFVVDMTVTPVRSHNDAASTAGEIVYHVATMRNITREVQLEGQFQQAQKMEALGRLAGGIAHDFNNLLTVIHLSARLLERQLRPEDPLWEHVQHIRQTGDRAAKLTKQLLSFSRREVIDPQVLSVNRIVNDLGRMLQRIIGEDVRLVTDLQEDLWSVDADPAQMEQVVMNLVINARDAMPRGGTLTIQTRNVTLDLAYVAFHVDAEPGEHVLLSVADTGEGMDAEVKAHLFEPFFTTKQRGQGTGLGLSTVFGIVKQAGGHIYVESEPGEGTCFNIYLPRCLDRGVPASTPSRPPDAAGATAAETVILVVEDDIAVRTLAVRVLQSYGCRVLEAGDGAEALRISAQHRGPIDLLVTDVVMPGMDGKKLADELQAARPGMAVLYMSGYADNLLPRPDTLPPDAAFLSKPFTIEDLVQKLQSALGAHGLRRSRHG